jgi:hypothetical protein
LGRRGKWFWVKTVIRQDLLDYQDLFFLHHFPDENDETQSTKGGINHVNPVDLVYVLFFISLYDLPELSR